MQLKIDSEADVNTGHDDDDCIAMNIQLLVVVIYSAAEPTAPPQNIRVLHVENDTLLIRWDPPPRQHRNGILLGYKV